METLDELQRAKGLYVRCPSCTEAFPVRKGRLFDATKALPEFAQIHLDRQRAAIAAEHARLREQRAKLQQRSFTSAATSGVGQTLEMMAASLPGLPTAPQDCRTLLKPLDYIAFVGASEGKVEAIRFMEVKTGRQRLSPMQRAIKATVEDGAVSMRVADHRLSTK